jgi:hypothetical protein
LLHKLLLLYVKSLLLCGREIQVVLVDYRAHLRAMTCQARMLTRFFISRAAGRSATYGAEISLLLRGLMKADFSKAIDWRGVLTIARITLLVFND